MSKKAQERVEAEELLRRHQVLAKVHPRSLEQMLDKSVPVLIQAKCIHDTWARAAINEGWVFGLARDVNRRRDPRLMPFGQLEADQQAEFYDIASSMRVISEMN
jgi:hypothetical protein